MARITGTNQDETLNGTSGDDVITARDGLNFVYAFAGNDLIIGGQDRDVVEADEGDDTVMGGGGADYISGGGGSDVLHGGDGDDSLMGTELFQAEGTNRFYGEEGNDSISAYLGDTADGGGGTDDLVLTLAHYEGDSAGYRLDLRPMDEGQPIDALGTHLEGFEYALVLGGDGDDFVRTGLTSIEVRGGLGNDTILLGGSYRASGGDGNDYLQAGRGANHLQGDRGNDTLVGRSGYDTLDGGRGDDVLTMSGRGGDLRGYEGDDRIETAGASRMTGGTGADLFVLKTEGALNSLIGDLSSDDVIDLSAIDSDLTSAGDQAFVLVQAFSGSAGEMRLVAEGNLTLLETDRDGDGVADSTRLRIGRGDHTDFDNFVA